MAAYLRPKVVAIQTGLRPYHVARVGCFVGFYDRLTPAAEIPLNMNPEALEYDEEAYVDVKSLPLKPPQPQLPPEKPTRRPWHPVMWDNSIVGLPMPDHSQKEELQTPSREYPHKQRIRNLKRLIAEGKVKATPETLIFFLCNKFAMSEERQNKFAY